MPTLVALLGIILVVSLVVLLRNVPEKSTTLTGIGIALTFVIGLLFVMLVPSFNNNWSVNTAEDLTLFHAVYTKDELARAKAEHRSPQPLAAVPAGQDPTQLVGYTEEQQHGRLVYQREGCMYCHSQQIRPLKGEMLRYSIGTSLAIPADQREYVWDRPHFLGTRRIGPDLSREGGKYSDDWHYSHFYYPRQMVPGSVMPAFTWMFDKDPDGNPVPNDDMRALTAYVQTLGYGRKVWDQALNGGQGGWRSWLKASDQQYSQRIGEGAVSRAATPVRGRDQRSPTNKIPPKSPDQP